MAYVFDIARKLIRLADFDAASGGDSMTNMRLQKMLYYEQGFHLARFGTPLFDDELESWQYGPVVPLVYDRYKSYGAQILPVEEDTLTMSSEEEDLFGEVFEAYREFSTIGLMNLTHRESPWLLALPHDHGTVISKESMTAFFKTQLQ